MKHIKKTISLLLAVCLLSAVLMTSVAADTSEREPDPLRYTGVFYLTAGIAINSWGKASCETFGELYSGYHADLEICLYRVLSNGSELVKYWDIGTVQDDFAAGKPYYVAHGTYYTEVTVTVYDASDNYVETVSVASGNYVY